MREKKSFPLYPFLVLVIFIILLVVILVLIFTEKINQNLAPPPDLNQLKDPDWTSFSTTGECQITSNQSGISICTPTVAFSKVPGERTCLAENCLGLDGKTYGKGEIETSELDCMVSTATASESFNGIPSCIIQNLYSFRIRAFNNLYITAQPIDPDMDIFYSLFLETLNQGNPLQLWNIQIGEQKGSNSFTLSIYQFQNSRRYDLSPNFPSRVFLIPETSLTSPWLLESKKLLVNSNPLYGLSTANRVLYLNVDDQILTLEFEVF